MPGVHHPRGQGSAAERARQYREQRGTRHEQGYTNAWGRARARFLAQHPLCLMCERKGHVVPANVVDHVIPHAGDDDLFWDESNWQPLCASCHNGEKRRMENAARRAP